MWLVQMDPAVQIAIYGAIFILLWSLVDKWNAFHIKRPPGPLRLPLLGNLHVMLPSVMSPVGTATGLKSILGKFCRFKPAFIVLHKLSLQYGPIMSIKFGLNHAIMVGTSKYAREVFCRENFADRYADDWFTERSFGRPMGLIFNNGAAYRKLKNFTIKNLKDFGFGRKLNMEDAVDEELHDFLHHFQSKMEAESLVKIDGVFTLAVLNILWKMVAGSRFSYGDEKLLKLIHVVEELSRSFDIGGNIIMAFPFLRHLAPEATGHAHQMRLYGKLHDYFREILHERQKNSSNVGNPQDFMDMFRMKIEANISGGPAADDQDVFTEEQFIMVCLDLFTAGVDTTANTLDFAILYMILNPQVESKVQAEIDEVTGRHRLPSMDDRQRMPYTQATLLEVQRMCNVIPLVHRICTSDTNLGGYSIAKGDIMIVNLHSVHMDETVWDNPKEFKPERFLGADGNLNVPPHFLPFGLGKRECIGEVLAKMALFKYFAAMLQSFTFSVPKGQSPPSAHPGRGFTVCASPFSVRVKRRV